ncbi:MAG TPA: helix-turn-helix transcriptional regulator [Longimicrobium sp.]|nr:helix-turn-helix transcriptional regulator [Longimicrobium sp.]
MNLDEYEAEIEARYPQVLEVAPEVDPPHYLALNVINLRSQRGMTQAQLAAAIGVSQPRIAKIERGDANPRLITLSKLAHALGVTLSELLVDSLSAPAQGRRTEMRQAQEQREPAGKGRAK